MLDSQLLDLLVCPLGKAPLDQVDDSQLVCTKCGLSYAIEGDIPVMLIDEAKLPEGIEKIEDLSCYEEKSTQKAES